MTVTMGVQRYEKVEELIEDVKSIREMTQYAWIFVDNSVKIPEEIAQLIIAPMGGSESANWSLIRQIKKKGESDITFEILKNPEKVALIGMKL